MRKLRLKEVIDLSPSLLESEVCISWPHNLSLDLCPKIIFSLHQPQNGAEDREHRSVMSDSTQAAAPTGTEQRVRVLALFLSPSLAMWPIPWESAPFSLVGINHFSSLHFVWTSLRKVILLLNHRKLWLIAYLFLCQPFCYFESYLSSKINSNDGFNN